MKLGIFDSGIGGEAVASALRETFPDAQIITVNDRGNVPYGDKTADEVIRLTDIALQPLLNEACDIIVLACNTATALAIEPLRSRYPAQKFIGIEPMIKTAATLSKTGTVAVCATPATLASYRYRELVTAYGEHLKIIEPDCSTWAYMIENNQVNHSVIKQIISDVCDQGADVIILGCTHYHWIKDLITELAAGHATVIEPSEAIGRRVQQLIN
ncbi:MAG TPA: aspartate/glutamate racemase family protein [Candidatus Saccharimonadales bacterium]|nr:aspartate/glutamate racemase family protein [Candidatus Saccharimonadales bacterium]